MDRLSRESQPLPSPSPASLGAQRPEGGSLPRVERVRKAGPGADESSPGIDDPDEESSIVRVQRVRARLAATAPPPAPVEAPAVVRDVGLYLLAFAAGAGLGVGAILAVAGRVAVATPDDVAATDLVAAAYARLDDEPQVAAAAFRDALAADPDDVAAQSGLGQAMILLGDRFEAESWLCRAADGSGSHAEAARVAARMHGILCR